ncbi:acetylxylan esterase [Eisenbergiella sp.]
MSVETMTLQEMKFYTGTNPRPEDYEAYWELALVEVASSKTTMEIVPSNLQFSGVQCSELIFSGTDGARIHAKYLRPVTKGKVPVVFLFHGYSGNSGDWCEKLAWIQQGFAVVAMDCRGQAGMSEDKGGVKGTTYSGHIVRGLLDCPNKLLFRQIFLDTAMLVKTVAELTEIDSYRMSVCGGSQGGALALVCAALSPAIKRAVVQYPFLSDYKRIWDLDCRGSAYEELNYFFRSFDPRHEKEEEFFSRLGYIDIQFLMPRVQADILWGIGLRDEACPASSQFAAYNRLCAHKKMVIYPDFGHEVLPGFMDEGMLFLSGVKDS